MTVLYWPEDEPNLASFRGQTVTVALSRRLVFLKTVPLPDVPAPELRTIVGFRLQEFLPLPPGDAAFDLAPLDTRTDLGRETVVAGVSAPELRSALSACQAAGVKVASVIAAASGAGEFARQAGAVDAVVVSPDGIRTAIDVVTGGRLRYSRYATEDAPLEGEILRTITAAGVPELPVLRATERLAPSSGETYRFELPEVVAGRAARRETGRLRLASLFLLTAVVLALKTYLDRDDAQKVEDKKLASAKRDLAKSRQILKTTQAVQTRSVAVNKTLMRAFKPAQNMSDLFARVGDQLPAGGWLTGITVERGRDLTLRGTVTRGDDVTVYLDRLRSERRLREVRLVFATDAKIEKTPVVTFSIQSFPVGNLPLEDEATTRTASRPAGGRS